MQNTRFREAYEKHFYTNKQYFITVLKIKCDQNKLVDIKSK